MQKVDVKPTRLTLKGPNKFSESITERYTLGDKLTDQLNNLKMSSPPSTPTSPNTICTEEYDVVPISVEDTERAIHFLRKFFFRDEPLNVEQELLETEDATCQELEDYCAKSIKENVSLMAVSASGKLVGVCINGASSPDGCVDDNDDDIEQCDNRKFRKILQLLQTIDKQADVFGRFPDVKSIIDVKILSVDGAWRGRGIAKTLMDRTRDLAREMGFTMMRVDCTSHYSARAVAKLGFDCVYTLKYADYQVDGRPVFTPEYPHTEVKVYVQRVD